MKRAKGTKGTRAFKNIGGTLFIHGEFIKPNEVFYVYPQDIPTAFMDTIISVDTSEVENPDSITPTKELKEYILVDKGTGWFDIVDQDGKKMNEKGMRKPDAEEALAALQEG